MVNIRKVLVLLIIWILIGVNLIATSEDEKIEGLGIRIYINGREYIEKTLIEVEEVEEIEEIEEMKRIDLLSITEISSLDGGRVMLSNNVCLKKNESFNGLKLLEVKKSKDRRETLKAKIDHKGVSNYFEIGEIISFYIKNIKNNKKNTF